MTDVTRDGATPPPASKTPANEKPATERSAAEKLVTERPATEKSATEKSATERPATEKSATERPATEAQRAVTPVTPVTPGTGGGASPATATPAPSLVPHEETDKLGLRLQQAVSGFVDEPRGAVEEADRVMEEIAARFTEAVTQRRRTLRGSWQSTDGKHGSTADTEQLRLALRDYRELAERLLHL
ncbi:hypothetical protein [Streptomyces sp. NPDC020298]|uniref:hypothetical protein n=1 Tax=unclassified Streptomyces TaxID=2593676 RepID=UPI0033E88126